MEPKTPAEVAANIEEIKNQHKDIFCPKCGSTDCDGTCKNQVEKETQAHMEDFLKRATFKRPQTQGIQPEMISTPKEEKKEEKPVDPIEYILKSYDNAPSRKQIDEWKRAFGQVFAVEFTPGRLFVWRTLRRGEYSQILAEVDMMVRKREDLRGDFVLDERIVSKCVLWPDLPPEFFMVSNAGTIPTLSQRIMEASDFIPPELSMRMVVKL